MFFFFFSSRRRHTRSLCDWSSDVCSSDLGARVDLTREEGGAEQVETFLHEEEIEPHQIGEYKVRAHRVFIRRWAAERRLDPEHVWRVRERCIAALAG